MGSHLFDSTSSLFTELSLLDLTFFIVLWVPWSLVLREIRCFLVIITRIFYMIYFFPTFLSDLSNFLLSFGISLKLLLKYYAWNALACKSLRPVSFFTVFWFTCVTSWCFLVFISWIFFMNKKFHNSFGPV